VHQPGDQLSVKVWNAQTGYGPAIYPIAVSSGTNTCTVAINSVSQILPQQTQPITINGTGFGSQSPYTGDSKYIELVDSTGTSWNAGHSGAAVTLAVSSWTDTQIVLSGFSGSYGTHAWCIRPGDHFPSKSGMPKPGLGRRFTRSPRAAEPILVPERDSNSDHGKTLARKAMKLPVVDDANKAQFKPPPVELPTEGLRGARTTAQR